jgi:hypothetical protein
MSAESGTLSKLSDKLSEIEEALRAHRKATVYDAKLLGKFDDLSALWGVAKQELEFLGSAELYAAPEQKFETIGKTASGTRPSKARLKSQIRQAATAVRALKIKLKTQATPQDYLRLKVRVDALTDDVLREIVQEAFRCWKIWSRRACIVLSWCAVEAKIFNIYRSKWTLPQIKKLVPESNRKEIQVFDDLTTVSDAYLLRGLRDARLLAPTEFLDSLLIWHAIATSSEPVSSLERDDSVLIRVNSRLVSTCEAYIAFGFLGTQPIKT